MTIGELKEQFERLGVTDDTKLYLVRLAACERDTGYEPICVRGFQQKGVGIFFYGPYREEVDYDKT